MPIYKVNNYKEEKTKFSMLNDLLVGWLVNERAQLLKCCSSKYVPKEYIHKIEKIISRS